MPRKKDRMSSEEEASKLLEYHHDWTQVINSLNSNFQTLQNRTQMILTLATLTLTITGFSGPKIAGSSVFSSVCMIGGLVFVLSSILMALVGTVRISWLTQIKAEGQEVLLARMITERNHRTLLFRWMLILLVIGLTLYVGSVITFLVLEMGKL